MSTPNELMAHVSYLLRQAALRAQAEVSQALAAIQLRAPHHTVMAMVETQPRSQTELSARLQTDRTTMVSIVDDLEKMKLVERRHHPTDRRAHEVTLTSAGRDALVQSRSLIESADECLLADLNPSEREQLRRLLVRLITSYDRKRETKEDSGHEK